MDVPFTVRVEPEGTVVLAVKGDLDVISAPQLRGQFAALVQQGHYDLIVDLEEVSFLDSSGLAVLVNALKRVRAHDGSLRVVCSDERILQIFRITGLVQTFTIHDTTADALAAEPSAASPRGSWVRPPRLILPGAGRAGHHAQP